MNPLPAWATEQDHVSNKNTFSLRKTNHGFTPILFQQIEN